MAKLVCYFCEGELPPGRRFFCNDYCRQEYHKNGMKPKQVAVKPMPVNLCWGCRRALAGKQRRWCSNRCRLRATRDRKRATALTGNKPVIDGAGLDQKPPHLTAQLEISVNFEQYTPGLGYYDPVWHIMADKYLLEYERILRERMNELAFGYVVDVRVTKRRFA